MKKSELRQIIREELKQLIPESHKPGDKVKYMGTSHTVVSEDEYIITLKRDEDGKIIKLNYNQFKKQEK
jgi:hypothetical protein